MSGDFGLALGDGPVYPVGLADGVLSMVASDSIYFQKVLWVTAPSYGGPVLIRGTRLDGPGIVHFSTDGSVPPTQSSIMEPAASPADNPIWREVPSYTAVPQFGCYGYQVDGTTFSIAVVFEARKGG